MFKKVIIALTVLLAIVGIGVGVYLVQQQQRIDNEAAVPASEGGEVEISLQPGNTTIEVGDEIELNVVLDTKQIQISGVSGVLEYNYQGTNPFEVISYEYQLIDSWAPASFNDYKNTTLPHRFEFALTHNAGYASTSLNIYRIKLRAKEPGSATLRFNIADSTVYPKAGVIQDILLIPTPEFYTYTVRAAAGSTTPTTTISPSVSPTTTVTPPTATPTTTISTTNTPTPTTKAAGGPQPTNTSTPTPTTVSNNNSTATPTTTQIAQANTATPTRTPTPSTDTDETLEITENTPTPAQLPVAANSTPTIVLGVAGALILLVGLALLL